MTINVFMKNPREKIIIQRIAERKGLTVEEVDRIVTFQFKNLKNLIQLDKPITIKLDYLGKFAITEAGFERMLKYRKDAI